MKNTLKSNWFLVVLFAVIFISVAWQFFDRTKIIAPASSSIPDSTWIAPSLYLDETTVGKERQMIIYGEQLVANTARFLGPEGTVAHISNGMNCQNCHLVAGTAPWGNNYGAVYSTYPKYRARSNGIDNIYRRINDCFERSLHGQTLDSTSYEMQCMYAYMKWLGKNVPKGKKPHGSGLPALPFMDRAADPAKGRDIYINTCQRCHENDGAGVKNMDGLYKYPPLWGEHSFTDGAGLYRIIRLASFIKNNMPFGDASHENPILTNEEAWDVAAFVISQPRPHLDQSGDWAIVAKKPIDEPFGPYEDHFSEQQHKYGPFQPIAAFYNKK